MALDKNSRKQRGKIMKDIVFPVPDTQLNLPDGYSDFILYIKERVLKERLQTVLSANASMILLYWEIGNDISTRQKNEGWGAKVIDRILC